MAKVKLLPSERDNVTTERAVLRAARAHFGRRKGIRAAFDHGHWWVFVDLADRDWEQSYDVVDVRDGFGFEEV